MLPNFREVSNANVTCRTRGDRCLSGAAATEAHSQSPRGIGLASAGRAGDHAGPHGVVGRLVDDDEGAVRAALRVGIDRRLRRQSEAGLGDVVHAELRRVLLLQRVDVEAVVDESPRFQ